jgi:O-antigen/teichoic acid export membrane protein
MNGRSVLEDSRAAKLQVRPSGLLGDFTWTLLGNGIFSVCQWGIIIILAKLATTEAVGQYSLSQAILGPVLMFAAFSLRSAVASDLKDQFTNREYVGFRLITLGAGLSVAILVAFGTARSTTVIMMVGLVGLTQSAELISDTLYGFHQRGGNLVRPATSMILKSTAGLAALIAGIWWGHSVLAGLAGLAATRAAVLVFYDLKGTLGQGDQALDIRRAYFPWRRHFHLFGVVFFLGLLALFSTLIGTIPRYFIEYYLGSRELGVFAAITSLTAIGLMPVAAFGMAAFVRLAHGFTDGRPRDVLRILGPLLGLSFAIGASGIIVAYFAGPQILGLLFRREYAARTDLLLLTMVMGAVTFLSASLGVSLSAARIFKPQATLLASVGAFEALCCWVLVPRMGLTGAAAACVAAAVVQLVGTAYILITNLARLRPARP